MKVFNRDCLERDIGEELARDKYCYLGGGSSGQQTSTSYQTNLPEYAQPYYEEMMARAQNESLRPLDAYTGPRVADFSSPQQQAQSGILNLQTPGALASASNIYDTAAGQLAGAGTYNPNDFTTLNYGPSTLTNEYTAQNIVSGYNPDSFTTAGTAEQYMNPFVTNVLNTQMNEMQKQFDIGRAGRDAAAVKAGAFGGSRQAVQEAIAEDELRDRQDAAVAQGLSQAYQQGMGQFNAEQQAQQAAGQMGMTAQQQTQLAQQQQEQLKQSAAQMSQQDAQFAAQHAKDVLSSQESADQFAAQFGQQGIQLAQQLGAAQENLAKTQQTMDMARLEAQKAVGAEQQALAQRNLDIAYEDFINARDNERQNLAFYNALLRGIPVPTQSQVVAYQPYGNSTAQMLGAGLTGLAGFQGLS